VGSKDVDHSTQFDLALHTVEAPDGALSGDWNYAVDLFDPKTIERLHQRFERLLAQMVMAPEQVIGDYDLLDASDHQQLADWNNTVTDHGQPEPVHRLFERQAAAHPDREALVFGDQRLSYGELDATANRLAHVLLEQGVSVGSLVGVTRMDGSAFRIIWSSPSTKSSLSTKIRNSVVSAAGVPMLIAISLLFPIAKDCWKFDGYGDPPQYRPGS